MFLLALILVVLGIVVPFGIKLIRYKERQEAKATLKDYCQWIFIHKGVLIYFIIMLILLVFSIIGTVVTQVDSHANSIRFHEKYNLQSSSLEIEIINDIPTLTTLFYTTDGSYPYDSPSAMPYKEKISIQSDTTINVIRKFLWHRLSESGKEYTKDDIEKARKHAQHEAENLVLSHSEWSQWSEKQKSTEELSLYEEESKTAYRWWAAQCTRCGTNNPYHGKSSTCHGCGRTLFNDQGLWKSVFEYTETNQEKTETIYGRKLGKYFGDEPYWMEDNRIVTIYRYRPIDGST